MEESKKEDKYSRMKNRLCNCTLNRNNHNKKIYNLEIFLIFGGGNCKKPTQIHK